jgi:hypothetical protein
MHNEQLETTLNTPLEADLSERVGYWSKRATRAEHALAKPLRDTILAVLRQMPPDAAPEHLAAQIESQVRAWQVLP